MLQQIFVRVKQFPQRRLCRVGLVDCDSDSCCEKECNVHLCLGTETVASGGCRIQFGGSLKQQIVWAMKALQNAYVDHLSKQAMPRGCRGSALWNWCVLL